MNLIDKLYFGKLTDWKVLSKEKFYENILSNFLNEDEKYTVHTMSPPDYLATIAGPLRASVEFNQTKKDVMKTINLFMDSAHPEFDPPAEKVNYQESINGNSLIMAFYSGSPTRIDITKNKQSFLAKLYLWRYPYGKKNLKG